MKDFTLGLLRHRCSNAMRIGKHIRLYEHTFSRCNGNKPCPNCGKKIPIQQPTIKSIYPSAIS